ncbi:MAG: isoleucine--tRNA ligase [Candidatus Onthovivens sp.]|nr:isoleucine--tRNA ligase [Mollicutes bacterium]MDY4184255.1 isoleucine--tRNA ligase [Candidatus Onthovivens sp.]MDY5645845.1 isoleucine--tRNA ligase [Candidatus Onthovivens sp.]MDY5929129.1 isoleucine--tRNA ligase [Candidatus Onthovivens sp.]MDY5984924.1 isoleucine--tRNA ligase [Candidatus Onthovivens sp.]
MELKDTLLMMETNFEMRGNLNIKEPLLVKKWADEKVYNKMNEDQPLGEYMLHDGPPYANGAMHCGHMLNRILKDFVVRYKNMCGYKTPFVFGWDTHGLPIENMVTKSGVNRKTTPIFEFREKCKEYALSQVERQKSDIRRLGCLGDYDSPYLTLLPEFEAREIHVFSEMALKGLIYKGLKPVYWSPSSESALAEAEIEYHDVKAYTIYVSFDTVDGKNVVPNDTKFIIWTTTPWTLPANLAICAHPQFIYGLFKTDKGNFVFLSELKDTLIEKLGFTTCELVKEIKGSELEGILVKHPFYDRTSMLILGDYVTAETGTGLVHIAPGHGEDDFNVCLKYGIKPYCPVDEHGKLTSDAGERLAGLFYEDANLEVLKILEENKCLLKEEDIVHSYPHDWRTHKPVIFRATPQWFCSIEPIRDQLIEEIKKVNWTPKWGETRMVNMIKDRADWCISRQRAWGVPIPIIYCEDNTPIIDKDVFDHIEKLIRENGSNIWYKLSEKELLPEGYTNSHSPNGIFRKEKDIMDVWFDSGSSWNGVLNERGLKYPADLYLEGSDQYRGWFNSSLILSLAVNGKAPYKNVVSHGFVMDEHWEKMSKSKGNGIDPLKIINIYGSDVCRLWASLVDYQQDARISESIVKTISEQYRKIRNTLRFLLGNLNNGSVNDSFKEEDKVDTFEKIDLYVLARLEEVKNKVIDNMDSFNFINAISEILKFVSDDLSSFYFEITKDILYCENKTSLRRRQVQTVLNEVLFTLMRLLNPILPFTMDEVNANYPLRSKDNVQYYRYPTKSNIYSKDLLDEYSLIKTLRNDVLKALEEKRALGEIKSSLLASVDLEIKDEKIKAIIDTYPHVEVERLFIVSKVVLKDNVEGFKGEVSNSLVSKHTGVRCDRCWNYKDEDEIITEGEVHLCPRCKKAME